MSTFLFLDFAFCNIIRSLVNHCLWTFFTSGSKTERLLFFSGLIFKRQCSFFSLDSFDSPLSFLLRLVFAKAHLEYCKHTASDDYKLFYPNVQMASAILFHRSYRFAMLCLTVNRVQMVTTKLCVLFSSVSHVPLRFSLYNNGHWLFLFLKSAVVGFRTTHIPMPLIHSCLGSFFSLTCFTGGAIKEDTQE